MDGAVAEPESSPAAELPWEKIVAEHETALLRYATRLVRDPAAAQDVVQNAFIKLFRGWKRGVCPIDRLKSWLYRVTHNEAVDHIRREARLSQLHSRSAEERQDDCAEEPSSPLSRADRMTLVLEHLGKLRPYEQQVVLLRLEEGLSYREISQVTGRTEGNVGNILFHAVRQLSASLRKAGAV